MSKQLITCACGCGRKKEVRTADIKRGWGKYFSKSCKARHKNPNNGGSNRSTKTKEKRFNILCEALNDERISQEYFHQVVRNEYPEFEDRIDSYDMYINCDIHPFSDEAFN